MLFNSFEFLVFLPIAFIAYWLAARNLRTQNIVLLILNYVFYAYFDWRFLGLVIFTSIWVYLFGLAELHEKQQGSIAAKFRVGLSLLVNLGILGYFKYSNFFISSFADMLTALGLSPNLPTLNIILPIGISFYTFKALGYTIEVYRHTITPTKDIVALFGFIGFFPQLAAGPIDRSTTLLPQFFKRREFDYSLAVDGCRQVLWGFFKKVLVSDSCACAVNTIYDNPDASSIALCCAAVLFSFQIYCDFSGYSDMAIGCGKLFGFRSMRNFAYPYFAQDIADFWRRWHISLTTWFRDYLYIPLGGSRCGKLKKIRNTFVIFLVSGLWHGANWTFVVWGAFHAVCFLPLLLMGKNKKHRQENQSSKHILPTIGEFYRMLVTFGVVTIGWIIFQASSMMEAIANIRVMVLWERSGMLGMGNCVRPFLLIIILMVIEWFNREVEIPKLPNNRTLRWLIYLVVFGVIVYWRPEAQQFIYFKF